MADTPDSSSDRRRPHLALPVEPTDDELARDWTLSEADRHEVRRYRGDGSRLRFAIQLCALRAYGRFANNFITVPVRIANYLGRQLGLPPVLFVEPPGREATDLAHERRIRSFLGMRSFDASTLKKLERWLTERAGPDITAPELVERAEDALRLWKVVLPAHSTLERVARSIASRTHKELFHGFEDRLSPELGRMLDEFLDSVRSTKSMLSNGSRRRSDMRSSPVFSSKLTRRSWTTSSP